MPDSTDRVMNFAANWIDANVAHPSVRPTDFEELEGRYLADGVASGLTLDEINERWESVMEIMRGATDHKPLEE